MFIANRNSYLLKEHVRDILVDGVVFRKGNLSEG